MIMGEPGEPADINEIELTLPCAQLNAEEREAIGILLASDNLTVVIDPATLTAAQMDALNVLLVGAEVREMAAAGLLDVAPDLTGPASVTNAGHAALRAAGSAS
jgi:hypothetical protein